LISSPASSSVVARSSLISSSIKAPDTGAALAALSESVLPAPATSPTTGQPMATSSGASQVVAPSRTNLFAAAVGVVAFAVVGGVVAVALGVGGGHHMVIETLPADLILVDDAGRVLGRSPLSLDSSESQLVVRARIGESLSPAHTIAVVEGHVIADFRADVPAPAPAVAPVAPPAAPAVVDVVEPVATAPVAAPAAPAAPAARYAPPRAPAAPAAPAVAAPAAAPAAAPPARPSLRLDDDNPNIGLIDDSAPKVAPLD
jgi:hypothetical protein